MNISAQKTVLVAALLLLVAKNTSLAQSNFKPQAPEFMKGTITTERAWWNVQRYDVHLSIDFGTRKVVGKNTIVYNISSTPHTRLMQIDLQEPLMIDSVISEGNKLSFERFGAVYIIETRPESKGTGKVDVYYSGIPKESKNAPYDGGFVWTKDSLNRPWVSVACQLVGGSVWYPCKDHYSEEPDQGASLTVTIPDSAGVVISNGRLQAKTSPLPGTRSYTWSVANPINNYNLTFYIGQYVNIKEEYAGEKGTLDLDFWVIDYNRQKAINHMIPEVRKTLKAFEKWWGPYPFYEDGFKMVESSYIGMEHQSAVAYGNKFRKGRHNAKKLTDLDRQTDRLIVHEIAHEWFGNNITMSDMGDRWVQEGFAAYGEELFIEEQFGRDAGRTFFVTRSKNAIDNKVPMVSPYGIFKDAGPDMYFKGWALIHMLREMVNNDAKFREYLRALNRTFYHKTIYSKDLEKFTCDFFKRDYCINFFDQYLRFPAIPVLEYKIQEGKLKYRLVADVKDLEIPLKLASHDRRLSASTEWREEKWRDMPDEIIIDPNFLVDVRRLE